MGPWAEVQLDVGIKSCPICQKCPKKVGTVIFTKNNIFKIVHNIAKYLDY